MSAPAFVVCRDAWMCDYVYKCENLLAHIKIIAATRRIRNSSSNAITQTAAFAITPSRMRQV